jgi:hypothetical protein
MADGRVAAMQLQIETTLPFGQFFDFSFRRKRLPSSMAHRPKKKGGT